MLIGLIDHIKGKVPWGEQRSGKWPAVRKAFLSLPDNSKCAVCGGTKKLEAHHIKPFHLNKALELDPTNLIALCEGNSVMNCHLLFGHLGNFKSFNKSVKKDAPAWDDKIKDRP